ncbi:putative signal peptide protein [Puccinia sorghi]|uniref:Putative signal peptide protein n=1 Tax=Puccinia sorghi TaxID=27349 RepID=A0A0L6USP0_9BASI|nr:putative signal peptide protein [Puccinia sorghi]
MLCTTQFLPAIFYIPLLSLSLFQASTPSIPTHLMTLWKEKPSQQVTECPSPMCVELVLLRKTTRLLYSPNFSSSFCGRQYNDRMMYKIPTTPKPTTLPLPPVPAPNEFLHPQIPRQFPLPVAPPRFDRPCICLALQAPCCTTSGPPGALPAHLAPCSTLKNNPLCLFWLTKGNFNPLSQTKALKILSFVYFGLPQLQKVTPQFMGSHLYFPHFIVPAFQTITPQFRETVLKIPHISFSSFQTFNSQCSLCQMSPFILKFLEAFLFLNITHLLVAVCLNIPMKKSSLPRRSPVLPTHTQSSRNVLLLGSSLTTSDTYNFSLTLSDCIFGISAYLLSWNISSILSLYCSCTSLTSQCRSTF